MNAATVVVLVLIALALVFAIRSMWKRRGKGSCGSCHGCDSGELKLDEEALAEIRRKYGVM